MPDTSQQHGLRAYTERCRASATYSMAAMAYACAVVPSSAYLPQVRCLSIPCYEFAQPLPSQVDKSTGCGSGRACGMRVCCIPWQARVPRIPARRSNGTGTVVTPKGMSPAEAREHHARRHRCASHTCRSAACMSRERQRGAESPARCCISGSVPEARFARLPAFPIMRHTSRVYARGAPRCCFPFNNLHAAQRRERAALAISCHVAPMPSSHVVSLQ